MIDQRLLNGNPKCTVIEKFDNGAVILLDGKRLEFPNLREAKKFVEAGDMEINVAHIFGSSINRKILESR